MYRKFLPELKLGSPASAVCCPLRTGTKDAQCQDPGGCSSSVKCVVYKVKTEGHWLESGLPIVSDHAIKQKILKLVEDWDLSLYQ